MMMTDIRSDAFYGIWRKWDGRLQDFYFSCGRNSLCALLSLRILLSNIGKMALLLCDGVF